MAWQATLSKAIGIDFQAQKLIAVVEFFDDADKAGTTFTDSFPIPLTQGTAQQQVAELQKAVEERGKQVRAITQYAQAARIQVPQGTTIPIPA